MRLPITLLFLVSLLAGVDVSAGDWRQLPAMPDREGFAGAFAGVSRGSLIVAGGANFPDRKPWEGGRKVWYDTVFVLDRPDGTWRVAGNLPRPLAYGVSASHGETVVCVGGSDAARHYADAFRLELNAGRIVTTPLPPLPAPVANGCGALVRDTLYVAGGQAQPDSPAALTAVYRIDLSRPDKWQTLPPLPGAGRMLSVAATLNGQFCVVGGVALVPGADGQPQRRSLKDAFRYDAAAGWRRMSDLPHPVTAAPSPAPADAQGFWILGGDDGSQVGLAPGRHRGFGRRMLRYDAASERWADAGEIAAPRVTVPCVRWGRSWIVPSGEARPGVRSPLVFSLMLESGE